MELLCAPRGFDSSAFAPMQRVVLFDTGKPGRDIHAGAYGSDLQLAFNTISAMVSEKYGPGERFDHLSAGSIWAEPRDWMMGLRQKERTLSALWEAEEGSKIPAPIKGIALEASALSNDTGFLRLSFEFTNFTSCLSELKANPF